MDGSVVKNFHYRAKLNIWDRPIATQFWMRFVIFTPFVNSEGLYTLLPQHISAHSSEHFLHATAQSLQ